MQAVKNFEVTLSAVHKSSRGCQAIVGAIARGACFEAPQLPAPGQLPSLQETCGKITLHHQEVRLSIVPFALAAQHAGCCCWPCHACDCFK